MLLKYLSRLQMGANEWDQIYLILIPKLEKRLLIPILYKLENGSKCLLSQT